MFHVEPRRSIARLISFYQLTVSPDTGVLSGVKMSHCPFFPRCSEYAKQSILYHGALIGIVKALHRIIRCYPGRQPTYDPVKQ